MLTIQTPGAFGCTCDGSHYRVVRYETQNRVEMVELLPIAKHKGAALRYITQKGGQPC